MTGPTRRQILVGDDPRQREKQRAITRSTARVAIARYFDVPVTQVVIQANRRGLNAEEYAAAEIEERKAKAEMEEAQRAHTLAINRYKLVAQKLRSGPAVEVFVGMYKWQRWLDLPSEARVLINGPDFVTVTKKARERAIERHRFRPESEDTE